VTIWQAVLLGIIQGLTEFLPVSSSGHLVIGEHFLGIREPELIFTVAVHFATVVAVMIFFRKELFKIIRSFFVKDDAEGRRMAYFLIIGTIPAAIAGIGFKSFFERLFESAFVAAIMLLVTAGILFSTKFARKSKKDMWKIKWLEVVFIGIAQALAIFPGISRSGATIAASLHLGITREDAARFSFLLSLPAIIGATLLQAREAGSLAGHDLLVLLAGMISAGLVGYSAVAMMLRIVNRGKLYYFGFYCFTAGILTLIFL